jgi:hypothetical protein
MSIFGISLLDNFGFEFVSNFMIEMKVITGNIINYLTNTQFYSYLNQLFSNKEDIPSSDSSNKTRSMIKTNSNETS